MPQPTCTLQLCQSSGTLRCWQKLPGGGEQALHGSNTQARTWAVAAFGAHNYQNSVAKATDGQEGQDCRQPARMLAPCWQACMLS